MENYRLSIKIDKMTLVEKLNNIITNVPDFPKEGVLFKDISPIFLYPEVYKEVINRFVKETKGKVDIVCGIESRGYLFGISIAMALNIPFILIRKKGKLPPPFVGQKYDLEYGTSEIEMKTNQLQAGQRVLIHDDLLATGGTTEAAAKLVELQGAIVSQFSFLIDLKDLHGKEKLQKFNAEIFSILEY